VLFATTAANNAARSYEHIAVRPLTGALGAEVAGIGGEALDVTSMTDAQWVEVRQASVDHLVVFFRDQTLDLDSFTGFASGWGPFGDDPYVAGLDSHPHVVRVLKEADEKVPLVFGGAWHSDWSFQQEPPAFTILYGHDVPDHGGDTLWSNLYLAADHLSAGLRATLAGRRAVHSPQKAYGAQATHNELVEHMRDPLRRGRPPAPGPAHPAPPPRLRPHGAVRELGLHGVDRGLAARRERAAPRPPVRGGASRSAARSRSPARSAQRRSSPAASWRVKASARSSTAATSTPRWAPRPTMVSCRSTSP